MCVPRVQCKKNIPYIEINEITSSKKNQKSMYRNLLCTIYVAIQHSHRNIFPISTTVNFAHSSGRCLHIIWYLERKKRPSLVSDNTEQMWRHIAQQWFMGASGCFMWYRLVWLNSSIKPFPWTERLISVALPPRSREISCRLADNSNWTCTCNVRLCPSDVLQRNAKTETVWTLHQGDLWKLYNANNREREI